MSTKPDMYGQCAVCGRWFPKRSLMTFNVRAFDKFGVVSHIPTRLCEEHWIVMREKFKSMEWQDTLRSRESLIEAGEDVAE